MSKRTKIWMYPVKVFIVVMILISVVGTSVFAAMTAPSKPISTEDGIIKCAANGAVGVMVEMLGGDMVSASQIHLDTNNMPLFMPVFGSANNQVPDPWLYNAFYNTASKQDVTNASSAGWGGLSGPGSLDTTVVNGTIPLLINRPDFIAAAATDVASFVDSINQTESYSPYYGVGAGMANPQQIMATVTSYAKGMQEVIDKSNGKLKARYGNPVDIASKFSAFYSGVMDYCNQKIKELNLDTVKVINISGVSNSEWAVQSAEAVDIFNEYIKKAGGTPIGQTDGIMTTSELLGAKALLVGSIALKTSVETAFDNAGYTAAQIPKIYVIPRGVYLWSVRSPEGALTVPWLTSLFYPELADRPEINPVYTTAYYYSNFYHYTGNLEEIIGVVLTNVSLAEGVTVDLSNWDSSIVPGVAPIKTDIIYEVSGGTNSTDNPSSLLGSKEIILKNPTKAGYTFSGWFSDKELKNGVSSITTGTRGEVTLYAKWITAKPGKVVLSGLSSKKAGQLTATLKLIKGVDGYVIEYSTNKEFKNSTVVTVKGDSKTVATLTKLKSGKTYYVRVGAYQTDSTKSQCLGAYSKGKAIKVK